MVTISGINGTSINSFSIGDGLSSDKNIYANISISNNPCLKYNNSNWQLSNDGINFKNLSSPDIGGDCSGTFQNIIVKGLCGIAISNDIIEDGYVLAYNQSQNKWVPFQTSQSKALSGDLSGSSNNAKVIGFNGIALENNISGDGYTYCYNNILSKWQSNKLNNNNVIKIGKKGLLTPNSVKYLLSNFTEASDESMIAFLAPTNGVLSNLICYCDTAPGTGESVIITVRKNGIDTSITTTISDLETNVSNIINSIGLNSGDYLTFKSTTSLNCIASNLFVSLVFTVPTSNSTNLTKPTVIESINLNGFGNFINMPLSGTVGDLYFATDAYVSKWMYSGVNWSPIIDGRIIGTKPPLASTFIPINVQGATLTDANGSLLYQGAVDATDHFSGFGITNTSPTAYIEVCVLFKDDNVDIGNTYKGILIGMRESATDKSVHLAIQNNLSTNYIEMNQYSNSNNRLTGNTTRIMNYPGSLGASFPLITCGKIFIKIRVANTPSNYINFLSSYDGIQWYSLYQAACSNFFTIAPDQVTIGGQKISNTIFNILHFKTGSE